MFKPAFALAISAALLGCHSAHSGSSPSDNPSLAGNWANNDTKAKMVLILAQDQSFSMVASNEFAGGILTGNFTNTSDHLTLNITGPNLRMTTEYDFKWLSKDKIQVTDTKMRSSGILTRTGVVMKGASIDAIAKQANNSPEDMGESPERMESTTCSSNLKQIGVAMALYAQDYDAFPPAEDWPQRLYPYTKSDTVFTCPTLAKGGKQGGYAMNEALANVSPKNIPSPAETIIAFESAEGVLYGNPDSAMLPAPRHTSVGVVYADGHFKNQVR